MVGGRTMEELVTGLFPSASFWRGQRVFLTGHTGFKGGWLSLWLQALGAEVCGYALAPPTPHSFFEAVGLGVMVRSNIGDVRDLAAMRQVFDAFSPTIVLHLAAQPLVRASYAEPAETYTTNVVGTVNVLELVRTAPSVQATLIVTTDKCYENREQIWPYRECDRLGGRDPYSSSKACAELVVSGYWWSYFAKRERQGLASGRAGNVIGGGDWSPDRLTPDLISAFANGRPGVLRRPESVRPWQHVLDPLCGYLLAIEYLCSSSPAAAPPAWNFGPDVAGNAPVGAVAEALARAWGDEARVDVKREADPPHEATLLTLDHTKALQQLGWRPRWPLATAIAETAIWYRAYYDCEDMTAVSLAQIQQYASIQFLQD